MNSVKLYTNQVGGHHCIATYQGCIMKPYNEQEARMYNFLPLEFPQLIPFIPKYYGVISSLKYSYSDTLVNLHDDKCIKLDKSTISSDEVKESKKSLSPMGRIVDCCSKKEDWLNSLIHKRLKCEKTSMN